MSYRGTEVQTYIIFNISKKIQYTVSCSKLKYKNQKKNFNNYQRLVSAKSPVVGQALSFLPRITAAKLQNYQATSRIKDWPSDWPSPHLVEKWTFCCQYRRANVYSVHSENYWTLPAPTCILALNRFIPSRSIQFTYVTISIISHLPIYSIVYEKKFSSFQHKLLEMGIRKALKKHQQKSEMHTRLISNKWIAQR